MTTISDFYQPGSSIFLTRAEMETRYEMTLNEETYIEFQYIFKTARRNLSIPDNVLIPTFRPFQPLLISIVNQVKKGCNVYYRFLRKKVNLNTTLTERESRWHNELNCTYGVLFWDKSYNLTSTIKNENKMKWLQYQINRNSLFTNYKVNKFKNQISPNCSLCSHVEGANPS